MVNAMTVSSSHGDSSRDLIFQVNDEKIEFDRNCDLRLPVRSEEHLILELSLKLCKYGRNSSIE